MKRVLFLIAILLIPTTLAEQFPVQNINSGFVGWLEDSNSNIGNYRLSYPSVSDGEDTNMAQNGPFAVVVFMPDNGESVDQYIWLQDGLSKWGYITLVVDSNWNSIETELIEWNNGTSLNIVGADGMFAVK